MAQARVCTNHVRAESAESSRADCVTGVSGLARLGTPVGPRQLYNGHQPRSMIERVKVANY